MSFTCTDRSKSFAEKRIIRTDGTVWEKLHGDDICTWFCKIVYSLHNREEVGGVHSSQENNISNI